MLNEKTMTEIETVFGMEGGALKAAIESDDSKELKIPTGKFVDNENTVFTPKELLRRDDKLKETHENAGREMLVKEFKRDNDLEFDGKTIEHLRAFDKTNILKEAGKEPEGKILELETDKKKLVLANQEWETKHDNLVNSNALADVKRTNDGDILGFMTGKYSIPSSDILTIFNSKHNIKQDGEGRAISLNGEILKDAKTLENIPLKSVVEDFSKQYAIDVTGGNGGGNEGGTGGSGNLDAFNKRQKEAGNNVGSEAYMREHAAAVADSTLVL
tara:strand:- start:673 stop:1491 length:819 start_codon:yes stop_codon:yes gene_type:complete